MTIVRTNQPKETYIAGSDRPETGFKATSVDSSADSDQFDPSPDLQAREGRPFDRLDVETGAGTVLNKSNEKLHPDLSGINRSRSVNSPELRELVEAVFGLTDRANSSEGTQVESFVDNGKRGLSGMSRDKTMLYTRCRLIGLGATALEATAQIVSFTAYK